MNPKLLTQIYDASLSGRNWNSALDASAEVMGSDGAILYQFPKVSDVSYSIEETNTNVTEIADIIAEYNEMIRNGGGSNFDQEGLAYVANTGLYELTKDSDIFTIDDAYFQRPEVMMGMKGGFRRRTIINLSDDPNTISGTIFLYANEKGDRFPIGLQERARLVAPHLSKALELFRFTQDLRHKYKAVLSVLDKISTSIFVLSEKGDVVVANTTAQELLDEGDGLFQSATGKLRARDQDASLAIESSVSNVALTARGENAVTGDLLSVPRTSSGSPSCIAIISPLRDAEMEIEKHFTGALLTVIDPSRPLVVEREIIKKAYGLSAAEGRLVDLVVLGLSNNEIADRLDLGTETVKSQLSSVFQKTGVRNRLGFVWRIFQMAPPTL